MSESDSNPSTSACRFRSAQLPWPSQMCATCGEWRDDHKDICRDCGVALDHDNVWEPGTCRDCARRLTADGLDKYYSSLGHYG